MGADPHCYYCCCVSDECQLKMVSVAGHRGDAEVQLLQRRSDQVVAVGTAGEWQAAWVRLVAWAVVREAARVTVRVVVHFDYR